VDLDELARLVGVQDEQTALAQVARRVVRERGQRQAEDVAAQRQRLGGVAGGEQAQRGEAEGRVAADAAGGDDPAGRAGRVDVDEAALGVGLLRRRVGRLHEQAVGDVLRRRVELGTACLLSHVEGANGRGDDAGQLRLGVAGVPDAEDQRGRRDLGECGGVALEDFFERLL